jgi:D-alanine transaminase
MPELAYLNGEILPIDKAQVPIEDRGYQFGDAVYEFIASYNGRLFYLEEHLDRLERSLNGLFFPSVSREAIRKAVLTLFEKAEIQRAGIYIQISRGVSPRNHAFPDGVRPQIVMTIREVEEKPPELRKNGATAITLEDFRWGRCDLKTVQLLPNVLAKQKALAAGVFDAIFVSSEGVVREATSSNICIVVDITRMVVIDLCRELDIPVSERFFKTDALYGAEESFLTGTVTEVLPIVTIDRHRIGDGQVGPVTAKLHETLRQRSIA